MSLTILLQNSAPLREKLREMFKTPANDLSAEMVAPPLCTSYALVGTAVDYLLRFKTQYLNQGRTVHADEWVADQAFDMLRSHLLSLGKRQVVLGRVSPEVVSAKTFLATIESGHEIAKKRAAAYLKSGKMNVDLVESAIFLARLDAFYRAGVIDPGLLHVDNDVVQDTKSVFAHAVDEHFLAERSCYLNPTFGKGSTLVGGADADLIIDDMLIDIKTTKYLVLDRKYVDQLICYYVLSLIGGVNGTLKDKPINRVGIYFSRHSYLWSVNLSEVAEEAKWKQFKKWFVVHLNEYPWWEKTPSASQSEVLRRKAVSA